MSESAAIVDLIRFDPPLLPSTSALVASSSSYVLGCRLASTSPRAGRFFVRLGNVAAREVLARDDVPAFAVRALRNLGPPALRVDGPRIYAADDARVLATQLWRAASQLAPWSPEVDVLPAKITSRAVRVDVDGVHVVEHGKRTTFVDITPRIDGISVDGCAGDIRVRALYDAFDVVNEPDDHERDAVQSWLVPRADRLLRALETLAKRPARVDGARIVWTLRSKLRSFELEAHFENVRRREQLHLRAIARGAIGFATEPERTAAALAQRGQIGDALRLLAGHPAVFVDDVGPIRIVEAELAASVDARDGGTFVATLRAAGVVVDARVVLAAAIGAPVVAVDVATRTVAIARSTPALRALAAEIAQTGGVIAAAHRSALVDVVERARDRAAPIEAPPFFAEPAIDADADARLFVRLSDEERGLALAIGVRPDRTARLLPPGYGPPKLPGLVDGKRAVLHRNRDAEVERARTLRAAIDVDGSILGDHWGCVIEGGDDRELDVLERLQREARGRDDVVVEWRNPTRSKEVVGELTATQLRVQVTTTKDWLELDGDAQFERNQIAFATLLDAIRDGRKFVRVAPNRFVEITSTLRELLLPIASLDKHAPVPSIADDLVALADAGVQFDDTIAWHDLKQRAHAARNVDGEAPAGVDATLRPYQKDGVRFLRRLQAWGTGGVLADDMGLGKTLQATCALVDRAQIGPQLVVAPTSVCFNWERELKRFAPMLRVHAFARAAHRANLVAAVGPSDVVVVSYALAVLCADDLCARTWSSVIFDEAQALKNADTQRSQLAKRLPSSWKLALSGTPIENRLGELWSLLHVTTPGALGSPREFRSDIALPVEKHRDPKAKAALKRRIQPFILRRTRDEVAGDLPEKQEVVFPVEMNERDRQLYEATRIALLIDLKTSEKSADARWRCIVGLQRLRRIACHAALVDADLDLSPGPKQIAAAHLVKNLVDNGHRALVFSQFLGHLDLVARALDDVGLRTLRFDGSTPAAERVRLIDTFQRGEADAFLISLKAGGTGINLTAADTVVHLDLWWNPAVEDQATARAHRLGQTKPVTVYRVIARDSIEERILHMHEDKRDLALAVLDGADAAAKLDFDALIALLAPSSSER